MYKDEVESWQTGILQVKNELKTLGFVEENYGRTYDHPEKDVYIKFENTMATVCYRKNEADKFITKRPYRYSFAEWQNELMAKVEGLINEK